MTGDGVYAPTLHWGIARDGFESVVTIYNYLGFAFRNEPPARTDAVVEIRLHDGEGASVGALDAEIATGGTLHLPLSRIRAGFQGAVTVAMRPKGRMARLSWCDGKAHRPIATSFFMLYRCAGFADFSHELFTVRADRDGAPAEWATVLFTDGSIDPSVIVMNNRIGCNGDGYGSDIAMQLYDLAGAPVTDEFRFALKPGGSRLVRLADAFGAAMPARRAIATVTGRNIEQPMTLHRHACRDFNIHHF